MRNSARSKHHQHGAIAVMAAIGLSLAVVLLASIDIGYLFYAKRDLQKIVDMAALAGATKLDGTTCASLPSDAPVISATQNAILNANVAPATAFPGTLTVTCGAWTASPAAFAPYTASQFTQNAVQVDATRKVSPFFGLLPQNVRAIAIAAKSGQPTATFSVGSKLLQVNSDGTVPLIAKALGLNLAGTSLLSYNGLANVAVTPSGLLQALGINVPLNADVGTIKSLVSVGSPACPSGICPLSGLLNAIGTVGGQQNLINSLGLQGNVALNAQIPLLADASGNGGLLAIVDTGDGQSVLNANVNALDLLTTALAIGNSNRALPLGVSTPLGIKANVGIIEAPVTGIGGNGTTAHTAQIRLAVSVDSSQLLSSLPAPLNALGNTLSLKLPILLDLNRSTGTLNHLCESRDSSGNPQGIVTVSHAVLTACITDYDPNDLTAVFNQKLSCGDPAYTLKDAKILTLANQPIVQTSLATNIALNPAQTYDTNPLSKGMQDTVPHADQQSISLAGIIKNLTDTLFGTLVGKVLTSTTSNVTLANALLSVIPISTTVLNLLNSIMIAVQSLPPYTLASVGNVFNTLLNGLLSNLIGPCSLIGNDPQQCIANTLSGTVTNAGVTVSKVGLTLSAMLQEMLAPITTPLSNVLSSVLGNLLGLQLGLTDVNMQDIDCTGGGVKLVQ
jgi:uncharacterized membrane protein